MDDRMKTLFLVSVFLTALMTGCSSPPNEANAPPSSTSDANANVTASAAQKASPPSSNPLPLLPQSQPGLPGLKPEAKPEAKRPVNMKPAANAGQPVSSATAPRLLLPVGDIDFGSVSQGKSLVRNLVVKNNGKGDLNIESVAPS